MTLLALVLACATAWAEPAANGPAFVFPDRLRASKDLSALQAFAEKAEQQGSYDLAAEALKPWPQP